MSDKKFIQIANQYITDVLSGETPACNYLKQTCQRQLDDLENPPEGFHFDEYRAERICKFTELIKNVKGRWANQHINLLPWQVFVLTTIFGWIDENGYRRYKYAFIQCCRKTGKSTLTSAVCLYMLGMDSEGGSQVYSAALTKEQAKIIFNDSRVMVMGNPGLKRHGFKATKYQIEHTPSNSYMRALAKDNSGSADGVSTHMCALDEFSHHKSRDMFDSMETSTGARTQPIIWMIGTASDNKTGVGYEQRDYVIKILNKEVINERYFGIIYTIDPEDDWKKEENWIKANPGWGETVGIEDFRNKAQKAIDSPASQKTFLMRHLNVYTSSLTAWLNQNKYKSCCDASLNMVDYLDQDCYLGVDLASKTDLASIAIIFVDDQKKYTLFSKNYINEYALENSKNSQYRSWALQDFLDVTPGNRTDFQNILKDIIQLTERFNVKEIVFDMFQGEALTQQLIDQGHTVIDFKQNCQNYNSPCQELEACILNNEITIEDNPVLEWCFNNVKLYSDSSDRVRPMKSDRDKKIDSAVAAIMALARAMLEEPESASVYEKWAELAKQEKENDK